MYRLTRRQFFGWAAGAATALLASQARAVPRSAAAVPIRAWVWETRGPFGDFQTAAFLSPVRRVPGLFNAVGILWDGEGDLALRVSADGTDWSPWHPVTQHELHGRRLPTGEAAGDLLIVAPSRFVQYRLLPRPGAPPPRTIRLVTINSLEGPAAPAGPADETFGTAAVGPPPIIPRAGWGADESLRYQDGVEIWPPEYRTVQKAVVHHTVTANFEGDPAATVRAIYYYHARTLGWGDIGYNYLIDWRGNIYEGRYGGPGVVGGHALQYNWGSVGIGCLGTFSSTAPTTAMRQSLERLLAWCCRYLDVRSQTFFIDKITPLVCGHRDLLATECPGQSLYNLLPTVRTNVAGLIGDTPVPRLRFVEAAITPTTLAPNQTVAVRVVVENNGTGTALTQGPGPGWEYSDSQSFRTAGFTEIAGHWRVGLECPQLALGVDHPFRWGLPDALEPGQRATIEGRVRLTQSGVRDFWLGLVQEAVGWPADGYGRTTVTVGSPPRSVFIVIARVTRR